MARPSALFLALLPLGLALAGCVSGPSSPGPEKAPALPYPYASRQAFLHGPGANQTLADPALWALYKDLNATTVSIGAVTFEPTIASTSKGALFMTSYRGTGDGTHIFRSQDGGKTWSDVGPFLGGQEGRPQVPSSNDPLLYIDRSTDRIIKFDMHALACMTYEYSDDEGATWSVVTPACGLGPLQDHQSIVASKPRGNTKTVGYANALTYCVNRGLNVEGSWCSTSLDGGLSWLPLVPGFPTGKSQCEGQHAHLASDAEGRIYRGGVGCPVAPTVWRSDDNGFTWTEHLLPDDRGMLKGPPGSLGSCCHDVAVTTDAAGNVYAFWAADDGLPYLTHSIDHGESWSETVMVAAPGVKAVGFPAIAAGDAGRIAFGYVGTGEEYGDQGSSTEWDGYIGTSLDALDETPAFASVRVNHAPLSKGFCGDRRCGGFGDFIDIDITSEGRPYLALSDNTKNQAGVVGTFTDGPALVGNATLSHLDLAKK